MALLIALPQTPAAKNPSGSDQRSQPCWRLAPVPTGPPLVLASCPGGPRHPPSPAPALFRHQTGTLVMPASLSHQVLNLTASPSSSAGISPHLGTLPSARTTAGLTPRGRTVHGSTPNSQPDTYVLKIFPKVETAGSTPVGTVPGEASGASPVNWPHPCFPSGYMLVAMERPPGRHCSHSLCFSWWSSKKPAAGDSLIRGEPTMFLTPLRDPLP